MQAVGVVLYPRHLSRTMLIAVIVGSALFAINHLDTVLNGAATTTTWVKVGVTYLVPFVVSNVGLLVGTHRPRSAP
ncbi:MAG TPA: nitrate/nitrite transporter NrtS [Pseudonocardiaceae bacterium]|jgi:fatty-acid desaturase|nr:nitrate/nitrite transporter NrtS [Pseudonocardiaceae bacterium]